MHPTSEFCVADAVVLRSYKLLHHVAGGSLGSDAHAKDTSDAVERMGRHKTYTSPHKRTSAHSRHQDLYGPPPPEQRRFTRHPTSLAKPSGPPDNRHVCHDRAVRHVPSDAKPLLRDACGAVAMPVAVACVCHSAYTVPSSPSKAGPQWPVPRWRVLMRTWGAPRASLARMSGQLPLRTCSLSLPPPTGHPGGAAVANGEWPRASSAHPAHLGHLRPNSHCTSSASAGGILRVSFRGLAYAA